MSTLTTYAGYLRTVYGEFSKKLLGHDTIIMQIMGKSRARVDAETHSATIAFQVDRIRAQGHSAGVLPPKGRTRAVQGVVTVARIYGRGELDLILFDATKSTKAAFASAASTEMEAVLDGVKDLVNQLSIWGGATRGFIIEQQAATVTVAAQDVTAGTPWGTVNDTWVYDGDFSFLDGTGHHAGPAVVAGTLGSWIRIRLVRMDTYADITPTGANANMWISAYDAVAGTITISHGDDAGAGGTFTTVPVGADYAVAVLCHTIQATDSNGVDMGRLHDFSHDMTGIFDILANPTYFTIDRTDATGEPVLQSYVIRQSTATPGVRAAWTLARYNRLEDLIKTGDPSRNVEKSSIFPTMTLISPLQRSLYIAAVGAGYTVNLTKGKGGAPTADAGFAMEQINGKDFTTSSDWPNGIWGRLNPKTFKRLELGSAGFSDKGNGTIFKQVDGMDFVEFYYSWYLNQYCMHPKANGLQVGVTL